MNETLYAEIVLPVPVDKPFTYLVPPALHHRTCVGMRAVVPFHQRVETGYIVGMLKSTDLESVKSIIDLPDDSPVFPPDLIELCKWIAEYYCCSWGEALQTAVPAGISIRTKVRYSLNEGSLEPGRYTDKQRAVIAEIHRNGPTMEKQLAKAVGAVALSNTLRSLTARGIILAEPIAGAPTVSVQSETYVCLAPNKTLSTDEIEKLQRRAPKQAAVYLDLAHSGKEQLAAHLYEKHLVNSSVLRQLENKGLIERSEREIYRSPDFGINDGSPTRPTLNEEQQSAFDALAGAMDRKQYQTFLLKGVTGSGKTEVYLRAIEHALSHDRDAIILVPEISLTPQTVGRFKARFQTAVAVLHSGLGAGERYDEWRRAQRGEVRIVVGARSAIFAPLPRLGMVVVDEEHDNSYKQNETPRYHARDAAIMRAKINNAVCVLGSATPSVESFFNSENGKSVRLELHRRATNAPMPTVELIDMRAETRAQGANVLLSRRMEQEIEARVKAGEQTLLLLNRRGFSPFVLCPQCGWVAQCTDCMVTMTYHAHGAYLNCHYCNKRRGVPQVCDECHFNPLLFLGAGTQKIEELLLRTFPTARIERMDADTTSGKDGHARILGRLAAGEIDILVGTQMIAKGHDYPGVTFVGVLNADIGLGFPDFRAAESTFQLLTQVAGRAGRGEKPGLVYVQSYRPHHYAVAAGATQNFAAFYELEIKTRESAMYPPFRRLANLMVESEDPLEADRVTGIVHRHVRQHIEALGYQGVEILGPSPASVRRVKKKYRWNIGLLSKSAKRLNTLCRHVRDSFLAETGNGKAALKIDLDPYGIY